MKYSELRERLRWRWWWQYLKSMVTFYLLAFFFSFFPRKIIKGGEMNFSNADPIFGQ